MIRPCCHAVVTRAWRSAKGSIAVPRSPLQGQWGPLDPPEKWEGEEESPEIGVGGKRWGSGRRGDSGSGCDSSGEPVIMPHGSTWLWKRWGVPRRGGQLVLPFRKRKEEGEAGWMRQWWQRQSDIRGMRAQLCRALVFSHALTTKGVFLSLLH